MPTASNTFTVQPNTTQAQVFEVMKNNRNKTSRELHEFLPHLTLQNVSAAVNALKVKGLVTITDHKRETSDAGNVTTHRCYSVDWGKVNKPTPTQPAPQPNQQVDILNDLIKTLKAERDALEQWKQAAVVRYPDLDIDPAVLKARELLAAQLEEDGKPERINDILRGSADKTSALRAIAKLLGENK